MAPTTRSRASNANDGSSKVLISVLLPTYKEKENLPLCMSMLPKYLDQVIQERGGKYEILIIDDGKRGDPADGTLEIAEELSEKMLDINGDKIIKVFNRGAKLGLGSAYQYGIKQACGDYVLILDADLSHHPKYIPDMVNMMLDNEELDIISGTRYKKNGGVYGWDLYRKLTSSVANYIATTLLRPGNATDLTGSFRLYKKAVVEQIMNEVQCKGYGFQMEVMVRAMNAKFNLGEVPIVFCDRIYGSSKLGAQEIVGYLEAVWYLFTKY